jgi:hypothetical protein
MTEVSTDGAVGQEAAKQPEAGQAAAGAVAGAGGLTSSQVTAMGLICSGVSVAEAARTAGVSRGMIYRWIKHDPVFRAAYNEWAEELEEVGRARVTAMTEKATAALMKGLEAGDSRLALQLLSKLGMVGPSGQRSTDVEEIKRRTKMEERKRQLTLEKEERKVEMEVELGGMMG